MRKSAVVVTAAVSAVLAGGIMLATTAVAEETPAAPSTALPDLPEIPQLPGADGVPVGAGLPAVPMDPAGQAAPAATEPGDGVDPAKPAAQRPGAATPGRPAADDAVTRPAPASPTAAKPAAAADRPAGKPAADKPARGGRSATVAAAQQDVTTSQALSTDPHGSVQQQALTLVNESRRRGGCDNLAVDRRLIVAANRHAAEMARRGYFAHEDSRGERAGDRVQDAGYQWSRYGENIARGQDSVAEVVTGWLNSPEHRANIMDCDLREVGVGLAFAADRTPYWVQDFATPQ
ncbi:CAP domain-containing protein [Actinoplanes sp. NPDC049599]|uniref:CAP domain-containing protein n=1 Tax=Actinoplanes sp. NPDC049599 TaxID=3363903 RepID=UPI0037AA2E78